jgi:hypothetical protein
VAFACADGFRAEVEATGFKFFPSGLDYALAEAQRAFPEIPPPGPARLPWMIRLWGYRAALAMAEGVTRISEHWRPDLVVRDPFEFGGCLAGDKLDIPHVAAGPIWFGASGAFGAALVDARAELGLPAEPPLVMPYRHLTVATMPSWWISPDETVPANTHFVRPESPDAGRTDKRADEWDARLPPGRPVVHATLGTTEVVRTPGLYESIFAALRDEPVTAVVAVGRERDPAEFGAQPGHVIVERFVAHDTLLPRCDVVLTSGGMGSVMACMTLGVPMVVVPVNADQPRNAQRCVELGVARQIRPDERTPENIRVALRDVLENPSYKTAAARCRADLEAMPSMSHATDLLETLVRDHRHC